MSFEYYYGTPMMNYVNQGIVLGIAVIAAVILALVLFFTFLSKKNEGKFTGFKEKVYNFLTLNRFYAEDILKLLYILLTCVFTVMGLAMIVIGSFVSGIIVLVLVNIGLRIAFELLMMFIILCKKTVSMDRKLDRISNFYDDRFGFDDEQMFEDEEEDFSGCSGDCGSCGGSCAEDVESKDIPF